MAFPFWWVGGLTAALFLGAMLVTFMLLDHLMTRTADNVRSAMVPGLVVGLRTWTTPRIPEPAVSSAVTRATSSRDEALEDMPGPGPEVLERVHRRR